MKKCFSILSVIAVLLCCLSSCSNEKNKESTTYFGTVSELLSAIKHDPYNYIDKDIQVQGTFCKFENDKNALLFDRSLTSDGDSSSGVAFRYEARRSPNIDIMISDDILYTVAEDGDYITVSGTVKISDGKIYLDNCTYTLNS